MSFKSRHRAILFHFISFFCSSFILELLLSCLIIVVAELPVALAFYVLYAEGLTVGVGTNG